eukprot:2454303-Rhodomonas_salina.1
MSGKDICNQEPDLPPDLFLGDGASFNMLGNSKPSSAKQLDDIANFGMVYHALSSTGVSKDEWCDIVRSLAGLMHLGNCSFRSDTTDSGSSDVDTAVLENFDAVEKAAVLLQCDAKSLSESLLERHVKAGEEAVVVIQSRAQAMNTRDALLKAVYSRLFLWLVNRINTSLSYQSAAEDGQSDAMMQGHNQIGILDIFGFEFYEINSFEQLTINFANESLQMQVAAPTDELRCILLPSQGHDNDAASRFFNKFVFKNEQEEYEREKIPWSHVVQFCPALLQCYAHYALSSTVIAHVLIQAYGAAGLSSTAEGASELPVLTWYMGVPGLHRQPALRRAHCWPPTCVSFHVIRCRERYRILTCTDRQIDR